MMLFDAWFLSGAWFFIGAFVTWRWMSIDNE